MRSTKRWAWLACLTAACTPPASAERATSTPADRASTVDQPPPTPAPRPPSPVSSPITTATGTVITLATVPTMGAVVIGPRVVVLSADFRHVTGVDITTGDEIWRLPLPDEPRGQHVIMRLGDRVLLRRAQDMIVLEPATGAVVARHETPMVDRRFLHRTRGMCLLNGSCSVQLIDCDDARPIGEPIRGEEIHFHEWPVDGESRMGGVRCMFDLQMIGRAGDHLIYSASGAERPRRPPRRGTKGLPARKVLSARDAKTGKTLWSHDDRHCGSCSEVDSGISPDGKVAWLSRVNVLERFDPRTGKVQWQKTFTEGIAAALWVEPTGLFVRTANEIALLRLDGSFRFRKPHRDATALPLLRRAVVPEFADIQLVGKSTQLAWLDGQTGEVVETVPLEGKTLIPDADGHPVLRDRGDPRDAGGQVIEGAGRSRLEVARDGAPSNQATLRERQTGAELLHIDRDAWLLGEWRGPDGASPTVHAALFVHGDDAEAPSEIRVIRLAPQLETPR